MILQDLLDAVSNFQCKMANPGGGEEWSYYDHLFKLLIIGDSGVGKSALLRRFADNVFSTNYITTIGVDFKIRSLLVDGKRVKLHIRDTPDDEQCSSIASTYYRGIHGVIIVYDVTNSESFANVKRWVHEVRENCDVVSIVLAGNKNDDSSTKMVSTTDAQLYADQMKIKLFETSAKENINVEKMLMSITESVLRTEKPMEQPDSSSNTVHFDADNLVEIYEFPDDEESEEMRKCYWEVFARDRSRFKDRISQAEDSLKLVLMSDHRQRVYNQRFLPLKDT